MLSLPIKENITLGNLKKFSRGLFLDKKKEKLVSNECADKVTLHRRSVDQFAGELSGGNQQKMVLAKLIARGDVKVYIFDEPTRGIDVGAKSEIYKLISEIVKTGVPSIVISSEIPELQALCDRLVVMREGRITGILEREQIKDSDIIMHYAIGG